MNKLEKMNEKANIIRIKRLEKENTALKKDLKRQVGLYLDLRELDNKNLQEIEKWKSGENISRAAIEFFVREYNEYCLEENRKDYMIRDEDVEGILDSLDPLGDDDENK